MLSPRADKWKGGKNKTRCHVTFREEIKLEPRVACFTRIPEGYQKSVTLKKNRGWLLYIYYSCLVSLTWLKNLVVCTEGSTSKNFGV